MSQSSSEQSRPASGAPKFKYQPLDQSEDCIRVIQILPMTKESVDIRCTIRHVKFSERPKYEALSYMWGDASKTADIFVDGATFKVTLNLRDALWFLRHRADGTAMQFWIDAICINQGDGNEKTRQIRIMPHIYFRAQVVLVWLGSWWSNKPKVSLGRVESMKTAHSKKSWSFSIDRKGMRPRLSKVDSSCNLDWGTYNRNRGGDPGLREATAYRIFCDDYWDRLWIIQEIGKATSIEVGLIACESGSGTHIPTNARVYSCTFHWYPFINFIETEMGSSGPGVGPILLYRQRRGRYAGGYSLRALLETHQYAKCSHPQDKIYGLVGLAEDSYGFVIDYQRSIFEVWKDTMLFLKPSDHTSVVQLAMLCFRLLDASSTVVPARELAKNVAEQELEGSRDTAEGTVRFPLSFALVGTVVHVGPHPEEIIKDLGMTDRWTTNIKTNHTSGEDFHDVVRESDLLMLNLLKLEDRRSLLWKVIPLPFGKPQRLLHQPGFESQFLPPPTPSSPTLQDEKWEHRLYQLNGGEQSNIDTACHLGITVGCVQEGDIVCRIPGADKSFLLRRETSAEELRILGTAYSPHYLGPWDESLRKNSQYFTLLVDANMLYTLFSPRLAGLLHHSVWKPQSGEGEARRSIDWFG